MFMRGLEEASIGQLNVGEVDVDGSVQCWFEDDGTYHIHGLFEDEDDNPYVCQICKSIEGVTFTSGA